MGWEGGLGICLEFEEWVGFCIWEVVSLWLWVSLIKVWGWGGSGSGWEVCFGRSWKGSLIGGVMEVVEKLVGYDCCVGVGYEGCC